MLCSKEQIEQKRQEALQKLAKKGLSPAKEQNAVPSTSSAASSANTPPAKVFAFKKSLPKVFPRTPPPYQKGVIQIVHKENKVISVALAANDINVTFSLISADKFRVITSEYNAILVYVFKQIPSKFYDVGTRTWIFHIRDYQLVVYKLAGIKALKLKMDVLPFFVINYLSRNICECDIDINKIDPELSQTLLPFQLEGVRIAVQREGRCLIADDMGLGKTFQALAVMNYYMRDWPLLIVTTTTMKQVWEDYIMKYIPSFPIIKLQIMLSSRDYIGASSILIISHDMLARCTEKLLERKFGCIIIDESHVLKNFKAKITQAATQLSKKAKRILLLSGTPALSRPSELYSQLNILDDTFFGSFIVYASRYCNLNQTPFGLDSSGKSNLQELEIILREKFMIRRTKADVLMCIPKKTQEVVKLNIKLQNFSEAERRLLGALADKYAKSRKPKQKHSLLLTFYSETANIKISSVCSYIMAVLTKGVKFLVFAHHQKMMNAIEEILLFKHCNYIRIDGSTSGAQRKHYVNRFQTNDNVTCALLSLTAVNAGITLTAAELVIFAELHWNPSILSQAESRAHRIGQGKPIVVKYLLAEGTADDEIWPMLESKQQILNELGLCHASFKDIFEERQVEMDTDAPKEEEMDTDTSDKELIDAVKNCERTSVLLETELKETAPSNASATCMDDCSVPRLIPNEEPNIVPKNGDTIFNQVFDDDFDDALCNINTIGTVNMK